MGIIQETIKVKKVRKPSKRTLKKWYDMTQDNCHAEVRLAIARYFGHSIDPDPDCKYGLRIVDALSWINESHSMKGFLECGLVHCRGIITRFMLMRIGDVYGKEVQEAVNRCL